MLNLPIPSYHALYDFLLEVDPELGEKLADSSEGEYDFILEELNIRRRGEVTIDPKIFKGRAKELYQMAKKNLDEWDEEEYISYIDQALVDQYRLSCEFFYEIMNHNEYK